MAKKKKKKDKLTSEFAVGYKKFMKGKQLNPGGLAMFEKALGRTVKK